MTEHNVTAGGYDVTLRETDGDFEVIESSVPDGGIEKFKQDIGITEGSRLTHGSVDEITGGDGYVKVHVNDENYDVFSSCLEDVEESSWAIQLIEFEHGYVKFRDTDF